MERIVGKRNFEMGSGCWSVVKGMLLVLLMAAFPAAAYCATVVLDWDPSTDADLAGYRVYYQGNSAAQPFQGVGAAEGSAPIDVAVSNSATINGLDPGISYYFAVTAYNSTGVESLYSNVVEIKESLPPAVSISSPSTDSSVNGQVTVVASATDNQGVTSVEFYLDGVLQGTDSQAPYGFDWDTSSLRSGIYTLSAKAMDAAGNVGQAEVVVAVAGDTAAPAVLISAPGNDASVTGVVTVSASASDDVGVTKLELYDNGSMIFAGNQSPVGYNWDSVAAGNGSHVLTARAFDAAGNVGSASVSVTVANDFSAPSVAIVSPAENGSTVGALVNVSAVATDDIGVTAVEFYLDGVLQGTDVSSPYGFDWNSASSANGTHALTLKAYDAAGRVGESASVAVNVFNDTTPPAVAIASPFAAGTVGGAVSVTASASDNVAVTAVEFYLNGVLQVTASSAPYVFAWNTPASVNGEYTLSAKAYDAAGNIGESATVKVNVFNDTAAPVVSIASPFAAATLEGTVSVTANASDNVDVTRVDFFVNGVLHTSASSAPYGFAWNTPASGNGQYTLSAKAYDAAGNIGESASVTVSVYNDTTAPAVDVTSPVNNSTADASVAVAVSASDDVAVARVELYLNGVLLASSTSAPYTFNWNCSTVPEGAYQLSAKAYDAKGNVGYSSSVTVTVKHPDTAPPTVTISSPASEVHTPNVRVTASANDNVAVSKMELYFDGVLIATMASNSMNLNIKAKAGTHSVTIKAYDAAMNVGTSTKTFIHY